MALVPAPPSRLFRTLGQARALYVTAVRRESEAGGEAVAERLYREVVRLVPLHWQALNNLGACAFRRKAWGPARSYFQRALEAAPNAAEVVNNMGLSLQQEQRLEIAAAYFERAFELDPGLETALANWALCVQGLGRHREALRHWRSYLRLFPDGPDASFARRQEGICAEASRR